MIAQSDSHGRLRRLILPGVLVLAAFVVLVSLGNWQVRRLAWKADLIARVTERPLATPVDLRSEDLANLGDPSDFLEENEYRPGLLFGEYAPAGEVLVFTSLSDPKGPFGGPGYWVLTPFVTPPGASVYVNRGFVPEDAKADYTAPPAGRVTLQGLIRAPERGSWLTPAPDLQNHVFYARDVSKIARATGTRVEHAGFFIDLDGSGMSASGLPQAGETRLTFTNNHLQYAITWYGLAAALLAVFAVYVREQLGDRDKKPA